MFEERLTKASVKQPKEAVEMNTDEELPPPPTSGAPSCGPPTGERLLLAMTHQETGWIDELKEYLRDGSSLKRTQKQRELLARPSHTAFTRETCTASVQMELH